LVTAIAMMHNIIRAGGEEVIPTASTKWIKSERFMSAMWDQNIPSKTIPFSFLIAAAEVSRCVLVPRGSLLRRG
jgi:hypothetical protein